MREFVAGVGGGGLVVTDGFGAHSWLAPPLQVHWSSWTPSVRIAADVQAQAAVDVCQRVDVAGDLRQRPLLVGAAVAGVLVDGAPLAVDALMTSSDQAAVGVGQVVGGPLAG